MALYTKKKDVERYVKELLAKVKTDEEVSLQDVCRFVCGCTRPHILMLVLWYPLSPV